MSALSAVHAPSASQGRAHFKELLDAAVDGRVATVQRDDQRVAVVDARRLRDALEKIVTVEAVVVHEEREWAAYLTGLPISAAGGSIGEAVDDLILAAREYTEDWNLRLRTAPNHADSWGFVQLVELSNNDQLRAWLTRAA